MGLSGIPGVGDVANAVIEGVSLACFPRKDGVAVEKVGDVSAVVERSGVRCLRW